MEALNPFRFVRRRAELQRSESGSLLLNEHNLKLLCEQEGLYEYPQMNKKLYLHFKVIERIENLSAYVNLKSLYLENNVIKKIENLEGLVHLENLFLQNNMISEMMNLHPLKELKILNLANNNIFVVAGLAELAHLQTLTLAKNYLSSFDSFQHLGQCSQALTSIDLSDNRITVQPRLFDLIPQVKCLYLTGNPLVRELLYYRRNVVASLKQLMYLDQRTVDSEERLLAEAWKNQGDAGMKKAKEKIVEIRSQRRNEEKQQIMKNIDVFRVKKVHVFTSNIHEANSQILKLRGYMADAANESMSYFYQGRILEMQNKIRQNQSYINGLYARMGMVPPPPVLSQDCDTADDSQRSSQKEEEVKEVTASLDELD